MSASGWRIGVPSAAKVYNGAVEDVVSGCQTILFNDIRGG
jgi:hypothetical protein